MVEVLQVKKLSEYATIPKRASQYAAGFDLSSACDVDVPPRGKALVKTDISIAIPENTYARIAPRSGLAVKNFIDVGAGVVDYDYRGNVGVVLFNHSDCVFSVKRGDRIAQLILERISMADIVEVCELSETTRGEGGFGSSGVKSLEEEIEKVDKYLDSTQFFQPRDLENSK
jgi:dUTP pyrophosphatase